MTAIVDTINFDQLEDAAIIVQQLSPRGGSGADDLEEIQLLAESAGAQIVGVVLSKRSSPHRSTFIGSGKVDELRQLVQATKASMVIVDHAVSPVQERNLERAVQCAVIDRTRLILDIFAQRASSREGQLQVELAQLKHLSTRLVRGWTHLERQKGGIGLRGPGETQLETDRRLIGKRIKTLSKRLARIETQRHLRRRSRNKVPVPTVALVGYTNAGKSSLFNRLSQAHEYAADQLFSTLDPKMRRLELPRFGSVILSDTVGFIRELPHGLVSAFHATLEEVANASILVHVVDQTSERSETQIANVESVLEEIGAIDVPRILVFNKIDLSGDAPAALGGAGGIAGRIRLSARTGAGVEHLLEALSEHFRQGRVPAQICLPPGAGKLRSSVYGRFDVENERILESGDALLDLNLSQSDIGWLNANREFRAEYWRIRPQDPRGEEFKESEARLARAGARGG